MRYLLSYITRNCKLSKFNGTVNSRDNKIYCIINIVKIIYNKDIISYIVIIIFIYSENLKK